jgi:outer membrane receptor protein involved in Fe transport
MMTIPYPRALLPISVSLAFAAMSGVAFAQQTVPVDPAKVKTQAGTVKPAQEKELKVQKVEVSGAKGYDERRQDTASKIVVTQEEIVRFGDTNITDVLKRLPGVTVGGAPGRGAGIRMRGMGSYTQVMLNGEPSPPGFSLDSIAPDNIERIEIIRSATAELSTQAIAGAINIILKKAIQTAQREIKLGINEENGQYFTNANLQLSDKVGRMSYAISGNAHTGNFDRPSINEDSGVNSQGEFKRRIVTSSVGRFTNAGISPRVNWNLQNGDIITSQSFFNINQSKSNNTDQTTTISGQPLAYASTKSHGESEGVSLRSNLTWVHRLADSAKLDTRFGISYNQRDSSNRLSGVGVAQSLTRVTEDSGTDKSFTFGGKYNAPFIEDHTLAAGWDGSYSQRNETNLQNDIVTGVGRAQNFNETFSADVQRLALFIQDEWAINKNWSLYAGLRWEGINTRSQGQSYGDIDNKSKVWSPILQGLWKLPNSKSDQLRFGLTRTYKAPNTNRLIPRRNSSTNNSALSPDSMGNPNLRPELAWGLDFGFEHYLKEGGNLSANLYMRRIEDITRTNLAIDSNGLWVSSPINDGKANVRGLELDAKFPLRAFLDDAPQIEVRANLSFNFSSLSSVPGPNNRLDSQTPVSANFGMDYKMDELPLTLGGNFSFQNAGLVRVSSTLTTYGVPKRSLDLFALWKLDGKTNIRVGVSNALRQPYFASSSVVNPSSTSIRKSFVDSHPSFRINFEHKF